MIAPALATRLEKAATDGGFDLALPPEGDWLRFGSSHVAMELWLTVEEGGRPVASLSRADVMKGLDGYGDPSAVPVPTGASNARALADLASLHGLLRRAFQLARSLPNALLVAFEAATLKMPRTTEAERLVVQRVGQDLFRAGLMEYWDGKCAVTGLAVPELLRASHIKPWAACERDEDRLDVFNGLLLAPHLDALFDKGFITVAEDASVQVSSSLPADARTLLGLTDVLRVGRLSDGHREFLAWHREKLFKK